MRGNKFQHNTGKRAVIYLSITRGTLLCGSSLLGRCNLKGKHVYEVCVLSVRRARGLGVRGMGRCRYVRDVPGCALEDDTRETPQLCHVVE